jgi:hypothetical protein
MVPKGLYLEKSVTSAKKELLLETDYVNEAKNQIRFKKLLADDPDFIIPDVVQVTVTKNTTSYKSRNYRQRESLLVKCWKEHRLIQL